MQKSERNRNTVRTDEICLPCCVNLISGEWGDDAKELEHEMKCQNYSDLNMWNLSEIALRETMVKSVTGEIQSQFMLVSKQGYGMFKIYGY